MVPVVRNAENLTFRGSDIKRLAIKARDGQITVDDMTGGTLLSPMVVYLFYVVYTYYQSSTIREFWNAQHYRASIAVNGKVEIHPMMYVAFHMITELLMVKSLLDLVAVKKR
jgi:2-oxoglutarate dehydrogenase E2 component (dihydrolipoamide succinyltransferase)